MIVKGLRHAYLASHRGTDSAPTAFSASIADDDRVLSLPSSYPRCKVNTYHQHLTSHARVVVAEAIHHMLRPSQPPAVSFDDQIVQTGVVGIDQLLVPTSGSSGRRHCTPATSPDPVSGSTGTPTVRASHSDPEALIPTPPLAPTPMPGVAVVSQHNADLRTLYELESACVKFRGQSPMPLRRARERRGENCSMFYSAPRR